MEDNQKYLEDNGLPRRLEFRDGCIGEEIDGAFRNLLAISSCYGVYAESVAEELVKRYNPARLFQLHWQFFKRNGHTDHTEMRSQFSPDEALHGNPGGTVGEEIQKWTKDVQERHPLPDGAQWLMVNEESEHFVWAVEPAKV